MTLATQLTDYVHAAFTGIWVQTQEPDEAEREITQHAQTHEWKLAVWDIAAGLRLPASGDAATSSSAGGDPLAALRALPALGERDGTALLLLHNFNRFLNNPEVVQATIAQLLAGKQQRTFIVVLSPVVQIPIELEKLFVVLEHALPDREQLLKVARELTSDHPEDLPQGPDLERVLEAGAGLTRYEAEGAFALSLARHNAIRPDSVWELKAQALRKNNLLTLHRGGENFGSLGGLDQLKSFCCRALAPGKSVKARGIILLGVSGSGKSAFAKALGNEVGRPTLLLDMGTLLAGLVGQSEANLRRALGVADAMGNSILFCDELDKALSGVGSQGDSGVSTRLFGHLLTWLADHESDVFFIGTANDITRLPPEFTRAERFDGVFFVDLPSPVEKALIWQQYRRQFQIEDSQPQPEDVDWTGAEIKACCRLAALLDLSLLDAARQVVPVAVTAAESIDELRTWASGRCLSASQPGIYQRSGQGPAKPGRRIKLGPSSN